MESSVMACVSEYIHSVSIQQLSGSADAHGFIDDTNDDNWSEYASAYAKVQSKGGREFWKVDKTEADVSHVWWCPWSRTLAAALPTMRLVYDEIVYEIISVIDIDMAHEEIEIQTRRAV